MDFTKHFIQMLEERKIRREWIDKALKTPDNVEDHADGTQHYVKQIPENENRWLRVVVNVGVEPGRAITAFFDRRLRKNKP